MTFLWNLSLAHPLEHNSEVKCLFHHLDIYPRPLGQSEWLGGDIELSDWFNNQIIINSSNDTGCSYCFLEAYCMPDI